ncbi:cellulose biosynthesis cyclic di-GMP-binding regulatory protein BcsB [Mesorhizobium sp. CAU 1741]|uniref:cellulose biosynthesis cyclic di-GMP-binding regulatory protein BcsB n=1 Tax=Mesorhizobium sp. CAU 1741 TaxID=3140366 RepID=UPI00325BF62C
MKRTLIALMLLGAPAAAQQQPFDMSPERPPAETLSPPAAEQEPVAEPAPETGETPTAVPPADVRRHLLPDGALTLSGENPSRSWAIHLTAAQAVSAARLHLAFRNSVVVAPESSRLRVFLNNTLVIDRPVQAADGFVPIEVDVPPALLRSGRNEFSVRVDHRHRTDCTVASTYELWTELDPAGAYLSFGDAAADTFVGLTDLRALAPGAQGKTRIEIVAPAMERENMTAEILQLVQALSLYVNQPNQEFSVSRSPQAEDANLALRVLLGTAEDLAPYAGDATDNAEQGPAVSFRAGAESVAPTLLVSGRRRDEWASAINQILAPVDRAAGSRRDALVTENWRAPNAPMIYDRRSLTFAELGIPSQQFSGRRYASSFTFAIPSDFYAASYGEARLMLDAAFSASVLPGSSINVYVNGNIAASTPLTEQGGAIVNQLPIKVTMRHFRPGLNEIMVEANLLTEQDETCLPGAPSDETPRFAIFDSSRFVVPDYGRVGQFPNLASTSGTGYPYGQADEPVAIILDGDGASLSAAANILARIAVGAGRSIPLSSTYSTDAARQQHAIFVGAVNSIPQGVLAQVGVAEEARTDWMPQDGNPGAQAPDQTNLDEWRQRMEGTGLSDVQDWFSETFGITLEMMRFAPSDDADFNPASDDALLVAQGLNPSGTGVWTVVAAPTSDGLKAGTEAVSNFRAWERLAGRVSVVQNDMETVTSEPVAAFSFVESQEPTIGNYRLVAANWLSANILSYSLLLVLACLLLGTATSGLLSRLGRRR